METMGDTTNGCGHEPQSLPPIAGATREPLRQIPTKDHVSSVCYSPDGKFIAVGGSEGVLASYDASSGDLCWESKRADPIITVAYSPDGHKIACGGLDDIVAIFDAKSGDLLLQLKRDKSVLSISFSPKGNFIACGGSDKKISIFDATSGDLFLEWQREGEVSSISFSPDGTTIAAAGYDAKIVTYDVDSGELRREMVRVEYISMVCYSPDGRFIAAVGSEHKIAIYNAVSGKLMQEMQRGSEITSICYSPEGYILTCTGGETVALYDTNSGKIIEEIQTDNTVTSICYAPDASLLSVGGEGCVFVYDTTGAEILELEMRGAIQSVCCSPDGEVIVCGGEDKVVSVFNSANGEVMHELQWEEGWVWSIGYSHSGHFAIGGNSKDVNVYDSIHGSLVRKFHRENDVLAVTYSPDGSVICIGGKDNKAALYNAADGELIREFLREGWVTSISYSLNYVVVGGYDCMVAVYDTASGELLHEFKREGPVYSVCQSPNGKILCGGYDNKVAMCDAASGDPLWELEMEQAVLTVCFSPDASLMAVGGNDCLVSVYRVDGNTYEEFIPPIVCFNPVRSLAFYSSMELIIASSNIASMVKINQWTRTPIDFINRTDENTLLRLFKEEEELLDCFSLRRTPAGKTLISAAASKRWGKVVGWIASKVPGSALLPNIDKKDNTQVQSGVLKLLEKRHLLNALDKIFVRSTFLNAGTAPAQLNEMVRVLCKLADKDIEHIVTACLNAGEDNAFPGFVFGGDVYLRDCPKKMSCFTSWNFDEKQTSMKPLAAEIPPLTSSHRIYPIASWKGRYMIDKKRKVRLKILRVLLPDLCSFETLKSLTKMKSVDIFGAVSIESAVEANWLSWAKEKFRIYAMIYFVWLLALTTLCEVTKQENSSGISGRRVEGYVLLGLVLAGLVYFVFLEARQSKVLDFKVYWGDGWNLLQWGSKILVVIFAILEYGVNVPLSRSLVAHASAGAQMFSWIGLLYYLRGFDNLAWIVVALLRITSDMRFFAFILFVVVFTFSLTFRALHRSYSLEGVIDENSRMLHVANGELSSDGREFISIPKSLMTTFFAAVIGDFDLDMLDGDFMYSELSATILMIGVLIYTLIVSINALISFTGYSFDNVMSAKDAVLTKEKAHLILEMYCHLDEKSRSEVEKKNRWTFLVVPYADVSASRRVPFAKTTKADLIDANNKLENEFKKEFSNLRRDMHQSSSEAMKMLEIEMDQLSKSEMGKLREEMSEMRNEMDELKHGIENMMTKMGVVLEHLK